MHHAQTPEQAVRLGRSARQLERMMLDAFGLSPKVLLRRQRFLRTFAAIREAPPGSWSRLIDERYTDQPQFVRDFNDSIGMSPRASSAAMRPSWPPPAMRKALLGAPVQGLHVLG